MMYQCFHCRQYAVVWDNDASFEDFGFEGNGVVLLCHCTQCGAEIMYKISEESESDL